VSDDGDARSFDPEVEEALRHRAKRELRKRLRAVRRAVPKDARRDRSRRVCERVLDLAAFESATVIAGYVAMGGEVDPRGVLERAWSDGRVVALPRVDWERGSMDLARAPDDGPLEESGMGFMQPTSDAPVVDPDGVSIVLVPSVALSEDGWRLGMGKGYYDRLLPRIPRALRVGLGFEFQLLAEVPHTAGDERMDVVVTDGRVVEIGSPSDRLVR